MKPLQYKSELYYSYAGIIKDPDQRNFIENEKNTENENIINQINMKNEICEYLKSYKEKKVNNIITFVNNNYYYIIDKNIKKETEEFSLNFNVKKLQITNETDEFIYLEDSKELIYDYFSKDIKWNYNDPSWGILLIHEDKYENTSYKLIKYSAEWCRPCKRIREVTNNYLKENNYNLIESQIITKTDFKKKYMYIPLIIITDKKDNVLKIIQNSDPDVILTLLNT